MNFKPSDWSILHAPSGQDVFDNARDQLDAELAQLILGQNKLVGDSTGYSSSVPWAPSSRQSAFLDDPQHPTFYGGQRGGGMDAIVPAPSPRTCRYCQTSQLTGVDCSHCGAPDDGKRGPLTMGSMGVIMP